MFNTNDILLTESGNGGDIVIQNDDIALGEVLYNQVYLCLFGGNVEAVTRGDELPTEIRQDWWGNSLELNTKTVRYNSFTEQALNTNILNSTGRVNIQRAVEEDLKGLKAMADIKVNVAITGASRVDIKIELTQPDNRQGLKLQLQWDNAKKELIIERTIK